MNILVVAEHADGAFKKSTYELLGKAKSLGSGVSAVVMGSASPEQLGQYGASVVYHASGDAFEHYNSGASARAVQAAIEASGASLVLASNGALGRDVMPRLSARLKAGLGSDVTDLMLEGDNVVGHRAQYAGKVFCDVTVSSAVKLFTVRQDSFPQPEQGSGSAEVKALAVELNEVDQATKVTSIEAFASEVVDLTEAERIVSGGRSVKSKDNYDTLIRPLAASIGATPGASRAAVDDGYAAHSDQVGQTGKVVNPTLYIACGISGAIQHLAGMRTSRVIVAINKDKEAPIFKHATYGIVADMFDVCPELTRVLSSGENLASKPKATKAAEKPPEPAQPAAVEKAVKPAPTSKVSETKSVPQETKPQTAAPKASAPKAVDNTSVGNVQTVVSSVSSEEIKALSAEVTALKAELSKLSSAVSAASKDSTKTLSADIQRSEKNARSFQETAVRRYEDMDKLVQSEVRKVREILRQGIQNDTADLRAGVQSQTNIVVAALVVNILAIIGFFMVLFLS